MRVFRQWAAAWITAALLVVQAGATAQETAQAPPSTFSQTQIEQMVAPIALYPDALVAQILMASTWADENQKYN